MCYFAPHCKQNGQGEGSISIYMVVKVNHKIMTDAHHSVDADGTRRLIHALSWAKLKFYHAYDGINNN